MNTKIEKSKFIQYIPFIVLFLIFIIIQINLKPVADDIWFYNILRTNQYDNIIEFLIGRYYNWSSRLIIEMNIIFLVNLPDIIWKSLNSLIFVLIAYLTSKFFKNKYSFKNKNIINYSIASILVLILFFVSYHAISTCGWITVPLNYIWIIFFLLLHFYLLKEYISKEKLKTKSQNIIVYFLLFYSLIYVCNHEQGLIIFFIIYLLLISYNLIKKNRIHNIIYLLGFLILIMGSISFFSPGNHARSLVEARYFPGFSEFGVLTKVDIGLSSLFRLFIADNNLIALLFLLVFGIYNYFISKKTRIICLIPFISCFILNLLVYFNIFNISNLVFKVNSNLGFFSGELNQILIFGILYLIILICLIYGLFNIYQHRGLKISCTITILLFLGFINSILIGFAPSSTSRGRMFIFLFGFLYFVIYILISDLIDSKMNFKELNNKS